MIVSGEHRRDSVIYIHVYILPQATLPSRLPRNIKHCLHYSQWEIWCHPYLCLYMRYLFSLDASKIFFLSLKKHNLVMMCLDIFLVFPVFGNSLGFLDLWINSFHQIWKIFDCNFFSYIFSTLLSALSFKDSKYLDIRPFNMVSQLTDVFFFLSVIKNSLISVSFWIVYIAILSS